MRHPHSKHKTTVEPRSDHAEQGGKNVVEAVAFDADESRIWDAPLAEAGEKLVGVAGVLIRVWGETSGVGDRVEVPDDNVGLSSSFSAEVGATVRRDNQIGPGEPGFQCAGSEIAPRKHTKDLFGLHQISVPKAIFCSSS